MTERSRVRVPAGAAGQFSSQGSIFWALISVSAPPLYYRSIMHVKDPGHSAKSVGGTEVTAKLACTLCMRLCMK